MTLLPWREVAAQVSTALTLSIRAETVSLGGAVGRILASDIRAARPLPGFTHAVMDGYALGGPPPGRYQLKTAGTGHLGPDEAMPVATGERTPEGTATVVLAARARADGDTVTVDTASFKDNIRRAGEEASAGEVILRAGTNLDARHLALAAAAGINSIPVFARPRVGLIGVSESVEALPHLPVMAALLDAGPLRFTQAGVARRSFLRSELLRLAASQDLIVMIGESLGDETGAVAGLIRATGGDATFLRATMKPAKPILLGRLGPARIIGLSGTAYAVTAAAHLVLRPGLCAAAGRSPDDPLLPAVSNFTRERQPGRTEVLPVKVARHDDQLRLSSVGRFGQLSALASLDGFAIIEADAGSMAPGDPVLFHPLGMPLL